MYKIKEQINLIMADFDFHKSQAIMEVVFQRAGKKRMDVPSISELKDIAKKCLLKANEKNSTFEFGMFEAIKINGTLELRLVPEKSNPLSSLFR